MSPGCRSSPTRKQQVARTLAVPLQDRFDAGQTVPRMYVHVVPRQAVDLDGAGKTHLACGTRLCLKKRSLQARASAAPDRAEVMPVAGSWSRSSGLLAVEDNCKHRLGSIPEDMPRLVQF